MSHDLYWRSEIDEARALLSTLRKRKPGISQFVGIVAMHQILDVALGDPKAAELPERIRPHFCRALGLGFGAAQMNDDDLFRLHVNYSSR